MRNKAYNPGPTEPTVEVLSDNIGIWAQNVFYRYTIEYVGEYATRNAAAYGGWVHHDEHVRLIVSTGGEVVYSIDGLRDWEEAHAYMEMFVWKVA